MPMRKLFRRFAEATSRQAGKPMAFILAAGLVLLWATTGPLFGFGDTWQLVINTSTTIITFLMVFLIQSSQNRDTAALQIKLDELIRTSQAHNALLNLEELDEEELDRIRKHYCKLAHEAHDDLSAIETQIRDMHNDEGRDAAVR
ncbi:low affinity iron permease family protein [Rhodanobacter ginsengiterrae]|uniref:low affinity iron permease family protein n=1 Tax=Rhodanobacter ginsengiterrae TaxID=2008451 RepID=UPI003CF7E9AC